MMTDQELRKLALELAVGSRTDNDYTPDDIIARANRYFTYLKGESANG